VVCLKNDTEASNAATQRIPPQSFMKHSTTTPPDAGQPSAGPTRSGNQIWGGGIEVLALINAKEKKHDVPKLMPIAATSWKQQHKSGQRF
jgi:hypothetical protein